MTMALTEDASEYLDTNPLTADLVDISEDEFVERMRRVHTFPENLRRLLISSEIPDWIQVLAKKHGLSVEQMKSLSSLLRETLSGERSAATLPQDIATRLALLPAVSQQITQEATRIFIAPNYFQISQLYEKNQRRQRGSPEVGSTALRPQTPPGEGPPVPSAPPSPPLLDSPDPGGQAPAQPRPALPVPRPQNVVDLRNTPPPTRPPSPPTRLPPISSPSSRPSPSALPPVLPSLPPAARTGPSLPQSPVSRPSSPESPVTPQPPRGPAGSPPSHGPLPPATRV